MCKLHQGEQGDTGCSGMVPVGAGKADLPDVAGGLLDLCAVYIFGPAAFNVPHALVDQHNRIRVHLQHQTQASTCRLLCK